MKLQIIKLILWPKNGGELRDIDFVPGLLMLLVAPQKRANQLLYRLLITA